MRSPVCEMLGVEFPLFAFSHCRDVVAAVSRAGGFGVLGATTHSPESIEQELKWIDDHVDGKPYGLDVLIPENTSTAGEAGVTWQNLEQRIPSEHRAFTRDLLRKYGIELKTTPVPADTPQPFDTARADAILAASGQLRPHFLCTYLYELAGEFSTFYNADKVAVDDPAVRGRRLRLCARTLLVLETGLNLLSLRTLQRM